MTLNHTVTTDSPGAESLLPEHTKRPSPQLDPWKPCDLRGVFPDAVSEELFRNIGGAVGTMLPPSSRVVVAGDFRLSTSVLKRALSEGLLDTGVHVLDAGLCPTPLAYFSASRVSADAVLMVTASHNPSSHNGLKLMLGSLPTTPEQLSRIRSFAMTRDFRSQRGRRDEIDLLPEYTEMMLGRWRHLDNGGRSRVILDAGNGAWSVIAPEIFRRLGFDVTCISCIADGNFPDRSPDCSRASNLTRLRNAVAEQPNSIGIAWDGDGDRVAFVDEEGIFVSPDEIALLLTYAVLEEHDKDDSSNGKIVVDIKCSDIVRRAIEQNRGVPLLERTGHAFMRGRMVADQALMGLDACGHYFFRELDGGDDGLFAAFFVIDIMKRKGQSLTELRRGLPQIFGMPELRIPISLLTYSRAAEALTAAFPDASLMEIDGLRFLMSDGVVLVRESGTEPVISLRIEGFDVTSQQRILSQCILSLPELKQW
jgi:phosphomannomutase/phosphoglucomutase